MIQQSKVLDPTPLRSSIDPPTEEYRRLITVDEELTSVGLYNDMLPFCIPHYLHIIA